MAQYTAQEITDKTQWEQYLSTIPEANFLQSWQWGSFHSSLHKKIYRIGFFNRDHLCGLMEAIVEKAKRGKYMTIAGGPLIDWQNEQLVDYFVTSISKLAAKENCVFVRIRPQLIESEDSIKLISSCGFKLAPMHLTADLTSQLDLSKTEDDLLKAMRKSTRSEIKKANSLNLHVTVSTDQADINEFYQVQLETSKRQHFIPFSLEFLQKQFNAFAQDNNVLLYKAYYQDQLIALAFIIFYNTEATYHYGASTALARQYPGAYLIQWEAIKEAKRRGLLKYNFWGVAPEHQKDHRFFGVSIFKRGFGGDDVQYLHAHDLIIKPKLYKLNLIIETLRKKMRKL